VNDNDGRVAVSRRIEAPASSIFRILADPRRHRDLDGSGMVRDAVSQEVVSGVGDVFMMKMYLERIGDYETKNHVVAYELDRRIGWEPESRARPGHRWIFELAPDGPNATVVTEIYDCSRAPEDRRAAVEQGRIWLDAITRTLARLDELCTK
jgi:hypothetical protein